MDDGALVVVVGPSGSGKSTCLRIALGLESPDSGRVLIGDADVTDARPADRSLGMVFQLPALLPHLDVTENVGFGLRVRHVPRSEARERVTEAMETVGISHLADRRPAGLSGGEGQLVALARALVREPAAFLLDEPLSSLDVQVRADMRRHIRDVQRASGRSMLYVTHDQVEAMTMADQLAVLHEGEIAQVGTPSQVFERPATRAVAMFIGSPTMNMLSARVEGDEVVAGPFRMPLRSCGDAEGALVKDASSLMVGVRPEHLVVTSGDAASVEAVEVVGSEAYLRLQVDGEVLTARVASEAVPVTGSLVGVAPSPLVFHVFVDDRRVGP